MLRLPLTTTSTLTSSIRQAANTKHHARYASTSERSLPSYSIAHHKRPFRGGQNLSDRYKRLEKSLRGKMDRTEAMAHEHEQAHTDDLTSPTPVQGAALGETFRGFVIPKEPRPPESDECCMSGCAICVYDLYDESLTQYREAVQTLRTSLAAMNVPEHEWPEHIRPKSKKTKPVIPTQKTVSIDAFEEMERNLRQKKERELISSSSMGTEPTAESRNVPSGIAPVSMSDVESSKVARREVRREVRRRRKRKRERLDWASVYEGLRWVLFARR